MANEPERSVETLTDEEIETSRVGGVVAPRRAQVADTGDPTDAADTGDDAADSMESPGVVP